MCPARRLCATRGNVHMPHLRGATVSTAADRAQILDLTRYGFAIHPLCHPAAGGGCLQHGKDCSKPGKRPLLLDWPARATADRAEAEALFSGTLPVSGGISTKKSRKVVLDVDARSGGDRSFEE